LAIRTRRPGARRIAASVKAVGSLLLFGAAIAGLFTNARVSGTAYIVFLGMGVIAGILGNLGEATALLSLIVLLFGVELVAATLVRVSPNAQFAWWQPIVIAVAASVAVGLLSDFMRWRSVERT